MGNYYFGLFFFTGCFVWMGLSLFAIAFIVIWALELIIGFAKWVKKNGINKNLVRNLIPTCIDDNCDN